MSDVVLVALITGGSTALVGIAGLLLNVWTQHQQRLHALERLKLEHEERYRSDLYAKRLEIHQEAFTWTQRLGATAIRLATPHPTAELHEAIQPFMKWFDEKMLYLDPVSIHEIAKVATAWHKWVSGGEMKALDVQMEAAQGAIISGIGLKHVDWTLLRDKLNESGEDTDAQ